MRTVDEIKVDLSKAETCHCKGWKNINQCKECEFYVKGTVSQFMFELFQAIISDIPLDRLEQICKAEDEGRIVELPCNVGDTLYGICYGKIVEGYCDGFGYMRNQINKPRRRILWFQNKEKDTDFWEIDFDCFGKTVFITLEEAEKKLSELNSHE